MPNKAQRAFQNLIEGVRTAQDMRRTREMKRRTDVMEEQEANLEEWRKFQKQQAEIENQINKKRNEINLNILSLDKAKFFVDYMQSQNAGRDDITPNEMQRQIDFLKQSTGYDASGLFQTNKDEKSGVIKSYSFDTAESLSKQIDQDIEKEKVKVQKAEAAIKQIQALSDPMAYSKNLLENNKEYQEAVRTGDYQKASDMMHETVMKFDAKMSPRQAMTVKSRGKLETDIINIVKNIPTMRAVADNYSKEFLQLEGKVRAWWYDKVAKSETIEKIRPLSQEEKNFITKKTNFVTNVQRQHAQYVHDMSGAQVSVKEMERREKEMFNAGMNYVAFQAAYNSTMDWYKKGYRLRRIALQSGDLTGEELGREIDRMYALPNDPSLESENVVKVGYELIEQYKKQFPDRSEKEIKRMATMTLYEMGYIK